VSTPGVLPRRAVLKVALAAATLACPAAYAQTELSDLAKIRANGSLKVAVYKDNAPFSDGKGSDLRGLDVALAEALAAQLQLKLALLPFDAGENMGDDLRNMVWRGHYLGYGPADVMLHVPVDKYLMQKNRQVLILSPYMRQVQVLMHNTRVLPQVGGPPDLLGHKLAAERGTGTASALMGQDNGQLRKDVVLFNSGIEAATAVLEGKAAAAYVLRSQAEAAIALTGSTGTPPPVALSALPLPGVPDNGWPLGLAIKTDHKELGQALEKAMAELRASGQLLALFKQQGMTLTAP